MGGRIAAMPFLDIRPGLLHQTATARFALITPAMPPPPPPRSMLHPTLIDHTVHSLPFTQGEMFPRPTIPPRLNNENAPPQEEGVSLQNSNVQQEGDQDYRFPPIESRETVSQPSGGEQKKEGMPLVCSQENEGVSSGKDIDINVRHVEDDHEPQDMAVVDPCEGQEKLIGQLSPEGAHKNEREAERHSLERLRDPDLHSYESKLKNVPDSHDLTRPQFDPRQHFGSPPADLLLPFGRHPLEIRETFGRPPLEGRDHFGRLPPEGRDNLGRLPVDGRDHYGRPIIEGRNSFGRLPMDGREMFGRPPVDMRDHFGRPPSDSGRREQFPPDKPWGHRGDFDERPHHSFPAFGGQKGFPDDRPRHGNYRNEHRNAPGWNRGFESDAPRDYDDRRRSWERHRDRDDREFGFRREMNGNRFGRERQSSNWMPPQPQIFEYFPEATTTKEKADEVSQVNGEIPETGSQQQTVKTAKDPELCEKETSDKMNEEKDALEAEVKSQPVVESTETEGT